MRPKIFRVRTTANNCGCCYKKETPRLGVSVLTRLGCPSFYWIFLWHLSRFYRSRSLYLQSYLSLPYPMYAYYVQDWLGSILTFPMCLTLGAKIWNKWQFEQKMIPKWWASRGGSPFFSSFTKRSIFSLNDMTVMSVIANSLSFWWQKASHFCIADIREPCEKKNVLTFFTHNNIGLMVSILNVSKNKCEKNGQWWITNDSGWEEAVRV